MVPGRSGQYCFLGSYTYKVLFLSLISGLCVSPFQQLFSSLPLWWDAFLRTKQWPSGTPLRVITTEDVYARRGPSRTVGLPGPCQFPGAVRGVSLTGCFFRVVAHEALPCSRCFAEAKHVKEPHFFQMELYLVQILFQEHKAQGKEHQQICLLQGILKLERGPWTQDGQRSISVLRTRRECWEDPSPLTVEKNSISNSSGSVLNAVGTGPRAGHQGKWWGVRAWSTQNVIASRHSARISKKKGYPGGSVVKRNTIGGFVF